MNFTFPDAQTDSPLSLMVKSGGDLCVTSVLETPGHNDLEVNQWDVYDTASVLGECAEFLLDPEEEIKSVGINSGWMGSGSEISSRAELLNCFAKLN